MTTILGFPMEYFNQIVQVAELVQKQGLISDVETFRVWMLTPLSLYSDRSPFQVIAAGEGELIINRLKQLDTRSLSN